ncbi:hypothetical protein ZHAS_00021591 [Anopheles sinensis]|uniref:Uncharacterized protein n=1 Tax=Anopheles sinensis TaxID=74873 RepID=A0A084WSQ9_ANOSI|nr:hypothetical protein ZHAS_00021591 [Anopheles sinensis]
MLKDTPEGPAFRFLREPKCIISSGANILSEMVMTGSIFLVAASNKKKVHAVKRSEGYERNYNWLSLPTPGWSYVTGENHQTALCEQISLSTGYKAGL